MIEEEERRSAFPDESSKKDKLEGLRGKKGKICSEKNSEERKKLNGRIGSQVKKSIKEEIYSKTDVVELVKKLKLVDLLGEACLQKHHRILLPLVILRAKQAPEQQQDARGPRESGEVGIPEAQTHAPRIPKEIFSKIEEENQGLKILSNRALTPENGGQKLFEFKKNYEALKQVLPKNSIERICSEQILGTLSLIFEHGEPR